MRERRSACLAMKPEQQTPLELEFEFLRLDSLAATGRNDLSAYPSGQNSGTALIQMAGTILP